MYVLVRWLCTAIVRSLFRDVTIINKERIPLYGPVIFVGNHNNQFIDATMLITVIPRQVRFLVAEKSMSRKIVGRLARSAGCISVKRAEDMIYQGKGTVSWIPGTNLLKGFGTRFMVDVRVNDKIAMEGETVTIMAITSDTDLELIAAITFACPEPIDGVKFKVIPKVDQSEVYDAVRDSLTNGDTVGIFPEGGSHDRTTLLPLKPGVAVMSLCSIMEGAADVMIVPVGLTYQQAHKFQSRAIVHIGMPILVSYDLALEYQSDRRGATQKLLQEVEDGMRSCIVTAPDHDSMSCIKLCCSLYPPERLTLSTDKYYDLLQLLSKLFWHYENEPELQSLIDDLKTYQDHLRRYSIRDHEVWMLKHSTGGATLSFAEKFGALILSFTMGLPLSLLWGPLRIIAYFLAERHRTMALKGSRVKIRATDVLASYKVMVLLVLLPTFNILYGLAFGMAFFDSMIQVFFSVMFCLCVLPMLYYVSLQYVEKIIPLVRQLKTLIYVILGKINVWRDTERELITHRIEMQLKVRKVVLSLGPKVSPTFCAELFHTVPKVVLDSDSKRLIFKKDDWTPFQLRTHLENREEIF